MKNFELLQKHTYKIVTFYSMPSSILFIFRKRLNFIYLTVSLLALLVL